MTKKAIAADGPPHRFHLVLTDGERSITAAEVDVRPSGALVLNDHDGSVKVAYPAGGWRSVELETPDE